MGTHARAEHKEVVYNRKKNKRAQNFVYKNETGREEFLFQALLLRRKIMLNHMSGIPCGKHAKIKIFSKKSNVEFA